MSLIALRPLMRLIFGISFGGTLEIIALMHFFSSCVSFVEQPICIDWIVMIWRVCQRTMSSMPLNCCFLTAIETPEVRRFFSSSCILVYFGFLYQSCMFASSISQR